MKYYALLIGLALITYDLWPQDILYKTDGSELKVKVYEIMADTIEYYDFEGTRDTLLNLPVSSVFMIIYESGEKEVFKKNDSVDSFGTIPDETAPITRSSGLSKSNISFTILDNRQNKLIIGKQPSKAARAVGLIVQPTTEVKDESLKIYNYAVKNLSQILLFNSFQESGNSDYTMEISINDLYSKTETGLYGSGGDVSQNCDVTVCLKDQDKVVYSNNFKSLYTGRLNQFYDQVELLYKHYYSINSKKQYKSYRKNDYRTYASKGYFIDYIIVMDDLIKQLNQDDFINSLLVNSH